MPYLSTTTCFFTWLSFSHAADSGVLTESDKQDLVELNNHQRSTTALGNTPNQPMAKNMLKLEWDETLAESSKIWANRCKFEHDYDSGYGENLAIAGSHSDVIDNIGQLLNGVEEWYEEYNFFNYDTLKCDEGEQCGHYTQSLWANSHKMGCAYSECPFSDFFAPNEVEFGILLVCRYNPKGNYLGVKPYFDASDESEIASLCPEGFQKNLSNGLCENDGSAPDPENPSSTLNPANPSDIDPVKDENIDGCRSFLRNNVVKRLRKWT